MILTGFSQIQQHRNKDVVDEIETDPIGEDGVPQH